MQLSISAQKTHKPCLEIKKTDIEEKALQKCPYKLNNQTYFASECFYEDKIINGISLSVHEAKGLSNNPFHIDYLDQSQKLIYQAGCNIMAYNTYRRTYEVICETGELNVLRGMPLSTAQKQYIIWGQKLIKSEYEGEKTYSQIVIYALHKRQIVFRQKFLTLPEFDDIFAFMHPIKVVGGIRFNSLANSSVIIYKKIYGNDSIQFVDQLEIEFPCSMKNMIYDIETNSYYFYEQNKVFRFYLESKKSFIEGQEEVNQKPSAFMSTDNFTLKVITVLTLDTEIFHICINQSFIVLLVGNEYSRKFLFYSVSNMQFVFEYEIQSLKKEKIMTSNNILIDETQNLINFFQFKKSIIIVVYGKTSCLSIYSIYDQMIRHVRDTSLELENCMNIQKIFINPFSSEVMIVSRHYEVESSFPGMSRSRKVIDIGDNLSFKNIFLEISTFFITMEASMINVKKLGLSQKKYCEILTLPWMNEIYYQTENQILCDRWSQKFDIAIKCSAIHPTGQFLALGFSDCFKIYYLTYEGLQHSFINENVKECCSLSFSEYGNQFAVATSYLILIYECYSFTKKHQISLGVSHQISSMHYQKSYLYCLSSANKLWVYDIGKNYTQTFAFNPRNHIESTNPLDGFIFQIMKKTNNKLKSYNNGNKVNSIFYDKKNAVVIFNAKNKIYFINSNNYECMGCYDLEDVSCMHHSQGLETLFLGTFTGKIIAFPWPNKPINITSKLPTFLCHNHKIEEIQVSSNFFYLISITDNCLYKHDLTKISEMRKISRYQLQREYAPQIILSLDFITRKGLCQFTLQQYERKYEEIKEHEQESLNLDFILPEEREKQKNKMLDKLSRNKEQCDGELEESYQPLKIMSINMREKNKAIQSDIAKLRVSAAQQREGQIEKYRKEMSKICEQKQNLLKQLHNLQNSSANALKKEESILRNETKIQELGFYVQLTELQKKSHQIQDEKNQTVKDFYELQEIDQEKKQFYEGSIKSIDQQISAITQRSGFLMCRNTNLEKQIHAKQRKIQDIIDMNESITRSIQALPRSKMEKSLEKTSSQQSDQFYETEQRYQKQTKNLIEKNKAVNVSIQMYSKERDLLITLEKQIQKAEEEIESLISYLNHEKHEKNLAQQKISQLSGKVQEITKEHKKKILERRKLKNEFKDFRYNVALYLDGIIDLVELRKVSKVQASKMVKQPMKIQKQVWNRKNKIEKIITEESKSINLMDNHRKIFSNEKKKMFIQNQDLLYTYNSLSHRNKYLANIIKSQQSPSKKLNIKFKSKNTIKDPKSKPKNPTPFDNYVKFKTTRRLKTSPCADFNL